jgi:hypothetical protein
VVSSMSVAGGPSTRAQRGLGRGLERDDGRLRQRGARAARGCGGEGWLARAWEVVRTGSRACRHEYAKRQHRLPGRVAHIPVRHGLQQPDRRANRRRKDRGDYRRHARRRQDSADGRHACRHRRKPRGRSFRRRLLLLVQSRLDCRRSVVPDRAARASAGCTGSIRRRPVGFHRTLVSRGLAWRRHGRRRLQQVADEHVRVRRRSHLVCRPNKRSDVGMPRIAICRCYDAQRCALHLRGCTGSSCRLRRKDSGLQTPLVPTPAKRDI